MVQSELLTKNGLGLDAVANRWHLFRARHVQRVQVSAQVSNRSSAIGLRRRDEAVADQNEQQAVSITDQTRIARSDDTFIHLRSVCGDGDAGLLRARSAQPVVHPGLRRSLRARLRLRFSAGSVAVRIGRGCLVRGCDTALGSRVPVKMILHRRAQRYFCRACTFVTTQCVT
jgi:hypothetical protein